MELALELLRPIPSVAVIPIALVALGFGYRLEIVIVSVACFWPLLILARAAVGGVEPRLIEVARALRLSPLQRTIKIVAPAALPRIFIAFRLAAGISLIVAVTVEIAVNPQGLGYEVMTAGQALRPELMLAYLVWIGVVGFALNAALIFAQNRLFGEAGANRGAPMTAVWWRIAGVLVVAALIALWGEIAALKLVSPVFLPTPARVWFALVNGFGRARSGRETAGHGRTYDWAAGSSPRSRAWRSARWSDRRRRRATMSDRRSNSCAPCPPPPSSPWRSRCSGSRRAMALGVIGFGSIWPVLLATMHGFAAVEPRLGEVARALRMSRWQTIAKVSLPSATPDILAGLRLGLTVSLILAVVCEMIAGLDGLGQWVLLAARSYKSADIFAGVALLGAIGLVANATLSLIEARALKWRTSGRG